MKEKLTKKQEDVLQFIKKYISEHKYPPAIRDICKGLNLNSPATVHSHLAKIESKGYLKKDNSKNKTISVPLLGKVTAGTPIEAIEVPNQFFEIPAYLIPSKKEVFTLEVSGNSMINKGIFDGDIVIVQKTETAKNGDTVVAMTDDNEVTLKTFFKENGYFRLQPENDYMEPIILDSVTILGKAIGLYRKF